MQSSSKTKHSVREVCKLVLTDLIFVWKRAGIPTITKNSLLKRLLLFVNEANKLLRYQKSRRNSATFLELKANFDKLFDRCSCKCVGKKITNCNACTCKTKPNYQQQNGNFGWNKKTDRKMFIGPVDVKATKKIKTRLARQESRDTSRKKQQQTFV